jgi:hypothetical protein
MIALQIASTSAAGKKKVHTHELNSFVAKNENGHALLQWTTCTKGHPVYFDVQQSTDGINYTSIETVSALPGKRTSAQYSLIDKNQITGKTYYRILQADSNGALEYSSIIPSVDIVPVKLSKK